MRVCTPSTPTRISPGPGHALRREWNCWRTCFIPTASRGITRTFRGERSVWTSQRCSVDCVPDYGQDPPPRSVVPELDAVRPLADWLSSWSSGRYVNAPNMSDAARSKLLAFGFPFVEIAVAEQ